MNWKALRQQLLVDEGKSFLPTGWKLPVLPQIVTMFLQEANRPNCEMRKLSKILEQDPTLTCELLKHVNSAAMGMRHKSTTVHQAMMNLGVRRCKMLLLTVAVQSSIKRYNSQLFDLHQFWIDNLERALFAREIALEWNADADLAYTGAMLQDFLLPVLSHLHPQIYRSYWKNRKGASSDLIEYELNEFQVHHAQVAAACLYQWNVPDELLCGVLCHHLNPDQLQEMGLMGTHVQAIIASSLIPVSVPQYENAVIRLADWEAQSTQAFDLYQIAEKVDAYFERYEQQSSNRVPLVDRLEQSLTDQFSSGDVKDSLINRQLGNFVLESFLGEGAMGTVFLARHTMLERPAAVKVLSTEQHSSLNVARFEREVQMSSRLTHPNTISIYDFGRTHDGLFYYAMEYVSGLTLKQLVHLYGPQPAGRVIWILSQICSSLQEAHNTGMVHRDIKPENIILSCRKTMGDHVTVLDFGLVMEISDPNNSPTETALSGTPLYMAPESISQPGYSAPACDIYAIGAVGYYLLTGEPLFTGNDALDICLKQVTELPPPPSQRVSHAIPQDLENLIMHCLQKAPEKRPSSARIMELAMQRCRNYGEWSTQDALDWWAQNMETPQQETSHLDTVTQDATMIAPPPPEET